MIEPHALSTSNRLEPGSANMRLPLVQAEALQRVFCQARTDIVAVSHASCNIFPGDRIAITGRSGSGKSTLLHLFAGLDFPTSGTISWPALGPQENLRPKQIGVALQMPGLMPSLTVVENVALPLLLGEIAPDDAQAAARNVLDQLELANLADKLPEELSGGQAQRVALARACITYPRLILADEPTGQLDHPTAQRLFDLLLAALAGHDTALVIATHDPAVADRLDCIWEMQQGILMGPVNS